MNLDEIGRIARENMENRRFHLEREPGYVYYHGMRVANLSGEIMSLVTGKSDRFDPVLYTGALFHDIGKGFVPHNDVGADITRGLLKGACSADELEEIDRIVRFHCIRKHDLELPEWVLAVQDADLIDHFGTQEIWLNFLHTGYDNGTQQKVLDWWESASFAKKLVELKRLINFDISRALFEERLDYQEQFLNRFKLEAEGRIPDSFFRKDNGSS